MHRLFTASLLLVIAFAAGALGGVHCPFVKHYLGGRTCTCTCPCCDACPGDADCCPKGCCCDGPK